MRHISVQQVIPGPPVRVAAWCHRHGALRWFRGDRVLDAHGDASVAWRDADATTLRDFLRDSLHGYREGDAVRSVFRVAMPDARWVRENLPDPAAGRYEVLEVDDGIRVSVTAAVAPVARYVVGLGGQSVRLHGHAKDPLLQVGSVVLAVAVDRRSPSAPPRA